ncbi:MAG: hypothetical protein ACXWIU_14790, partial [Limisphaerales bacterium]
SISVTTPDAPVQSVALSFSNSHWQAQFAGLTNWNYLLEASSNLGSWQQVASNTLAINGAVTLVDTNNIVGAEYYRVRALRP